MRCVVVVATGADAKRVVGRVLWSPLTATTLLLERVVDLERPRAPAAGTDLLVDPFAVEALGIVDLCQLDRANCGRRFGCRNPCLLR